MADKLKALSKFVQWGHDAAVELTKSGGLGDMFHTLVMDLFKELGTGADKDTVLLAFDAACEEAESGAKSVLEEAYGKGATLTKEWPSFRQYKSRYKALIEKSGGTFDTEKFNTMRKVRNEVQRLDKERKEAMKGHGGASKTSLKLEGLSSAAVTAITEAIDALRKLPRNVQEGIAFGFKKRSFNSMANGKAKTAASGAAGGSAQTSAEAV